MAGDFTSYAKIRHLFAMKYICLHIYLKYVNPYLCIEHHIGWRIHYIDLNYCSHLWKGSLYLILEIVFLKNFYTHLQISFCLHTFFWYQFVAILSIIFIFIFYTHYTFNILSTHLKPLGCMDNYSNVNCFML